MLTSFDIISKRHNSLYFTPWFLPEEQPSKVDDSWEIFEEQDMVRSPDCIFPEQFNVCKCNNIQYLYTTFPSIICTPFYFPCLYFSRTFKTLDLPIFLFHGSSKFRYFMQLRTCCSLTAFEQNASFSLVACEWQRCTQGHFNH